VPSSYEHDFIAVGPYIYLMHLNSPPANFEI